MPVWKQAPELMAALTDIQNHPRFANQDIMSFAGMCGSGRELAFHVMRCDALLAEEES